MTTEVCIEVKGDNNYHVIMFHCPGCRYMHGIDPGRWTWNGDFIKPTINPSILAKGIFVCHSFVKEGKIQFLPDSTHELAGQTVDLEPVHGY